MAARSTAFCTLRFSAKVNPRSTASPSTPNIALMKNANMIENLPAGCSSLRDGLILVEGIIAGSNLTGKFLHHHDQTRAVAEQVSVTEPNPNCSKNDRVNGVKIRVAVTLTVAFS